MLDEMLGTEGKSTSSDLESEHELESSVDVNEPAEGESSVDVNEPAEGGTRYFARYPLEHPSLQQFRRFLTSVDGGGRSEKTALEMAVDVSKFLRYACGSSLPSPDWARLTDRDQLVGYLEKLKRVKVGPEGQLAKLDRMCMALKFLKVVIVGDKLDSPLHQSATHMEEVLAGWKGTICKEKRKLRKKRLQQLSSEDLSLPEVSLLLDCERIWRQFDKACTQALRKQPLPTALLDQCPAGSLLYKNWQRPGAVANATLEEFCGCEVVVEDGRPSYVMSAVNHKTSLDGAAKVVLEGVDHARIIQYKSTIRIRWKVIASPVRFVWRPPTHQPLFVGQSPWKEVWTAASECQPGAEDRGNFCCPEYGQLGRSPPRHPPAVTLGCNKFAILPGYHGRQTCGCCSRKHGKAEGGCRE